MKLARKVAVVAVVGLTVAWLVFSWFEADAEIRVLCSTFDAGIELEDVLHTLETGDYLRYRKVEDDEGRPSILVDSYYNLRSSRCVVEFESGSVVSSTYTSAWSDG